MHQLHMTLPLLDHLFIFCIYILVCIIPCFDVLYSGIGCITDDASYIDINACLKLGIFLFSLLTNSFVFFETCGFSYSTQTPCHSGGTTSSLFFNRFLSHWGQCSAWLGGELRKEVLLLMLSYFGNLVVFCLIFKNF